MIKAIPKGFNIFTCKNKRCYASIYLAFTFQRPSDSNNDESKYMTLFLNAPIKDRKERGIPCHQLWWVTTWLVVTWLGPIRPLKTFFVCGVWDVVAASNVPHEKNIDLTFMQVKVSKSVAMLTKKGAGIRTD